MVFSLHINNLLEVPITSISSLTPERAVTLMRAILRAECRYAKLSPSVLTISDRLTVADGGIDAEINAPSNFSVPTDCFFQAGLTGFQIKAGTTFRPWTKSAVQEELLNSNGNIAPEVKRLLQRQGRYTLICTGHDLTPQQRNNSRVQITNILEQAGFKDYETRIEVLGASQLAEFAERYPGVAALLGIDPVQEAWLLDEWQRDAHLSNAFESSPEQTKIITQIRTALQSETKHLRMLGEPGLGKTRIVLEAVKDENIAPYVLYIEHGSKFGQTKLFRQIVKSGYDKPLVLVIDELPESELSDIWRHLKPRCRRLKIVSLDHGKDDTYDADIERLNAPPLSDETIKKILVNRVGESREIDRWMAICEGSPRVVQAVADNLCANPEDLLKPPATVPIWTRFLHGYDRRDDAGARQIDCVALHLALFSRFGYEVPVGDEGRYIAGLIQNIDPSIGWARFQDIVKSLRARRVLQGSRTLFFVPKALHIYLWQQFWDDYGRGFDFTQTFETMPESLHVWFMKMFKYAGNAAMTHIIDDILKLDGIFSQSAVLTSEKGSSFLSILAEANPQAVLKLLEATLGKWTDQQLLDFKDSRQHIVWTLEKIAVWQPFTVRVIQLLTKLAANENSKMGNNSTGILVGLFCIGPEAVATEATPEARLPAMLKLLRANEDTVRRLGLKSMEAALNRGGMGFRIIGPEYQGMKERAKLWMPKTYDEWRQAKLLYFKTLVDETVNWPSILRTEVCETLLNAVENLIDVPPCTELAFEVLETLMNDNAIPPEKLNHFFWDWQEYRNKDKHPEMAKRLKSCERRYTRRDLASRFHRYVLDIDHFEWDEDFRRQHNKPKNRAKALVAALAQRIAQHPEQLAEIRHLLAPTKPAQALWYWGERIARYDQANIFLPEFIQITLETKHQVCLHGYLSVIQASNFEFYLSILNEFLDQEQTAWLGVRIGLYSNYDKDFFTKCLAALERRWIEPHAFGILRFGQKIDAVPPEETVQLLSLLRQCDTQEVLSFIVELLDSIPFDHTAHFNSDFVFDVLSNAIPSRNNQDQMSGYYWKNVCQKLMTWDKSYTEPLLDVLLSKMNEDYSLSYQHDVESLAHELVQTDPAGAWKIIKRHFEETLPYWRGDLLNWLKGGLGGFGEENTPHGAIANLPIAGIVDWIEQDPEPRAVLMAHAVINTLDDADGGQLTRRLLHKYGHIKGVQNGISATFHSGGWSGSESAYLKCKRDKYRQWLAAGFEIEVIQWLEHEIEYLDQRIEQADIGEERSRFD